MVDTQSFDDLVKEQAVIFADQIKNTAEFAEKEEEIRIESERALAVIQEKMGITLRGRHEHTIGTGRIDSVYGCVIIEYKNPHSPADRLSADKDSSGNQKVIKQIQKRFSDFKEEQQMPLNTMFGVGCDGKYFIFVRYREDKWFVEDPVEVSKYSAERFLWALINMGTKGKAFAPEYLAGDFGSDSPLSHEGIKILYDTICNTSSEKAKVFFQQWKILFGEVCGFDVDAPSDKIKKLAEFYGIKEDIRTAELLFSIHSYYSIFMKLLASEIVAFFHQLPTPLQKILKAPTTKKLKEEMEDLERGSIFHHLNITNFLEGDLFAWYPDSWNESIDKLVRDMANKLDGYNPGTLSEDPANSRDLLKKLYQQLFPKSVRHDLGEYYTPDWLAEHVLNELGYDGDPNKRLLDPACGSGTFLVMTINKIRKWYEENRDSCGFDEGGLSRRILKNVVGFDLNPLAVMAARTNYLISMRDIIGRVDKIEIPVYLCDSVMTPSEYGGLDTWLDGSHVKTKELKTSVANFKIPTEIAKNRQLIADYAEILEFCVKNSYTSKDFLERCKNEGISISACDLHKAIYEKLVELDKGNKNGIWARIIKNAFAPLFIEKFDYIAGNPPWITWGNLPEDYRKSTSNIWQVYDLFRHSGLKARLGSSGDDLSILMTYVSADSYLKSKGKLGFVITQSIFMSMGGGEGFRRLKIKEGTWIKPKVIHDLVKINPFEGATNRTAVFISSKEAEEPRFPIQYFVWEKKGKINLNTSMSIEEIKQKCNIIEKEARPISSKIDSPWQVTAEGISHIIKKGQGKAHYRARKGISTSANGIFWIKILKQISNNQILVQNLYSVGRKKIDEHTTNVDTEHVYPLIRGRDIDRWQTNPSIFIIIGQDPNNPSKAIPENVLKVKNPKTFEYFHYFEEDLKSRKDYIKFFKPQKAPFYSLFNFGEYTMSPVKVLWRYIDSDFRCSVAESNYDKCLKRDVIPLPDSKLVLISFEDINEAHYVCSLLNSSISRMIVKSYVVGTQISTHILNNVNIPKFDKNNNIHIKLSELSKSAHDESKKGNTKIVESLELEIDREAAKIWSITENELELVWNAINKKIKKNGIDIKTRNSKNVNIKNRKEHNKSTDNSLHNKISSESIMHLSHKAKYNDILNSRQRRALFQMAKIKSQGNTLTDKQSKYLDIILKDAIDQGILDAKCNHHECEICKEINDKLKS